MYNLIKRPGSEEIRQKLTANENLGRSASFEYLLEANLNLHAPHLTAFHHVLATMLDVKMFEIDHHLSQTIDKITRSEKIYRMDHATRTTLSLHELASLFTHQNLRKDA